MVEEYLWDYSSYLDAENNQVIAQVYFAEQKVLQNLETECK